MPLINSDNPKSLALAFNALEADEQAQFFDALYGDVISTWDTGMHGFSKQMQWAHQSVRATQGGREVMQAISAVVHE